MGRVTEMFITVAVVTMSTAPTIISGRLKRELPNFVYRQNISSVSHGMTNCPLIGMVRVT